MTPTDFAPYRAEITDCHCETCREVAYALSDVLDWGGQRHKARCADLLTALRAGTHLRMTLAERAAEARKEKSERLAQAEADGASAATVAAIERGYASVSMRDFYATGMGLGMTPRVAA